MSLEDRSQSSIKVLVYSDVSYGSGPNLLSRLACAFQFLIKGFYSASLLLISLILILITHDQMLYL